MAHRAQGLRRDCYAAVDIGASSGRVVVGFVEDGLIRLEEVHRFDNRQVRRNGHDCWDVELLSSELVRGLALCKEAGFAPKSVGIDTWGVDFVLLDAEDNLVGDAVAYRDSRTAGMYEVADAIMAPEELYRRCGLQRQPFNTIYQLLALQREHPEQLEAADSFLMIPDYLNFLLTGEKAIEYTNASTTGLLNAETGAWDETVMEAFDIPRRLFRNVTHAGACLGPVRPEIARAIGYDTRVVLPATHDTGSAYLAVPACDLPAVFLSSGTWSLLGVENRSPICAEAAFRENFTNEGGYHFRYRFLKNIMGLWMIQSIRRELNGITYVVDEKARTVTLTARPAEGYVLQSLTATCAAAAPGTVPLQEKGEGIYTFAMPAGDVTVTGTFALEEEEEEPWPPFPFTDVPETMWYYDSVYYVYAHGLMNGTAATLFSPGNPTTRGMLVTILYRMEGSSQGAGWGPFTDVTPGAYYAQPIAWAAWNGIVNGITSTTFAPDRNVTREQMAAILYRYTAWKEWDVSQQGNLFQFTDWQKVQTYARTPLAWAVASGLIQGKENQRLDPGGPATRAEVATILQRFHSTYVAPPAEEETA